MVVTMLDELKAWQDSLDTLNAAAYRLQSALVNGAGEKLVSRLRRRQAACAHHHNDHLKEEESQNADEERETEGLSLGE